MSALSRWLAGRSPQELAAVLQRRADTLRGAPLRDIADLAGRLQAHPSVRAALGTITRPAVQLLEALTALGGRARLAELTSFLDGAEDDLPAFGQVVGELQAAA